MSLSQGQFDEILREYDTVRMRNQQLLDKRYREIEEKIPAYASLTGQIASEALAAARQALTENDSSAYNILPEHSRTLSEKKAMLLAEYGYPADYLAPIYDCADCHDTGYINGERCHCLNEKITTLIYSQSGIKDILEKENFAHFRYDFYDDNQVDRMTSLTPLANIKKVVSFCKNYTENFGNRNDNLLFYGNTGVGKTFLTHCIAKELLDAGFSVIYLTSLQLFDILKKNRFGKEEENSRTSKHIEHILSCDLLIIDDLGTELTNSFTTSELYYFMEERFMHHKSIIISTNLSFDELKERYSERIFSRFTNYKFLKITGDDIRLKKAIR